jgi:hypothetical protein
LRRATETFLNASVRALKHGLQEMAKELGVDLGFWFKQDKHFNPGIAALRVSDQALAYYLVAARAAWSDTLVKRRNAVEHDGWKLPRVGYRDDVGGVVIDEPIVDGVALRNFVGLMADRLCCAIEDVTAHLIRRRMPPLVGLHEIQLNDRLLEVPERFRLTLATGGEPLWGLSYLASRFVDH